MQFISHPMHKFSMSVCVVVVVVVGCLLIEVIGTEGWQGLTLTYTSTIILVGERT
jgi:hypothetical protein